MPIYEYVCPRCGTEFELMRSVKEVDEPAFCPQCGQRSQRLMSVFASRLDFYLRAPSKPAFRKASQGESESSDSST